MLIVSWWFIFLIVNCLFCDLIENTEEDITQSWLSVGLTVIDLTLIILLFMRGI